MRKIAGIYARVSSQRQKEGTQREKKGPTDGKSKSIRCQLFQLAIITGVL
jgi:predicted site-specific integrase-resolvase